MFSEGKYMNEIIAMLKEKFAKRLLYVGLQGSYMRKEATENSDIDVMVVIDDLTVEDLDSYRNIIFSLENPEKSCGFICGKTELKSWNPLEICHLLNTTEDYYGSLRDLVPAYTDKDIVNFIKFSVNNLYHEMCHRYIHSSRERNIEALPYVYKGVFFILQNIYYLKTGDFIRTKKELLQVLSDDDKIILEHALQLAKGVEFNFDTSFKMLFNWCQNTICMFESRA